jgi:hypothetical protein
VSRFGRLINAGFGRCKHRVLGTCVDAADGCCAGVACALCVKLLDADGEVVDGVSLAWNGTGYSGSVGGFSFESYWLDNYGDCEFHVIISAGGYIEPIHIIKTKGDYTDAACCMNPGGETEVDDGTDTYTMTWSPVDPLILARRLVSEGCYERFCGDCDCAPRKLCLQVVSDDCSVAKIISLAENYADPDCPLPVWDLDFTCGTFSFSGQLALVRDEYTGGCILQMSGTRGGAEEEESQDYAVTDCAALSASFTLTEDYVDYIITISAADCDACSSLPCPDGCCFAPGGVDDTGRFTSRRLIGSHCRYRRYVACTCGDGGLPPGVSAILGHFRSRRPCASGCAWNLPLHCTHLTAGVRGVRYDMRMHNIPDGAKASFCTRRNTHVTCSMWKNCQAESAGGRPIVHVRCWIRR